MKNIILFIIMISFVTLFSRGLTNNIDDKHTVINGKATSINPSQMREKNCKEITDYRDREGWELDNQYNFNEFLLPNQNKGILFQSGAQIFSETNTETDFSDQVLQAIEKAPIWLQPELAYTFSQLSNEQQIFWVDFIFELVDPYIDEVLFSIAHSSPQFLSSQFCNPQVFIENAELIYTYDEDLSYVEVVDYGTSNNEDYYSTTRYLKADNNGNIQEIEVPREIYYMYLVHPKITDEIPAFIDPDALESNGTHQNNIAEPPVGRFWRDYLYNFADDGYPLLSDELSDCTTLWDEDNNTTNAVQTLENWISEVMEFTSNTERPHQPVRIYKKHIGRCGEHADLRAAVARTALIPATSILTISGDHTWNEFWDESWIHWDGGSINNPLLYENGWGRTYGSVFEIRSDGHLTSVSDTYSEGSAMISIHCVDLNDNPVDGARVTLKVLYDGQIKWDNWGYTNNEGISEFVVGEGRLFYARVDSDLGSLPINSDEYLELVETIDGETYDFEFQVDGLMPELTSQSISQPDDAIEDFMVEIEFESNNQMIPGKIIMDDIDDTEYYHTTDHSSINYFTVDLINYCSFMSQFPFDSVDPFLDADQGEQTFFIPQGMDWYFIFANPKFINNPQHVQGTISTYHYEESAVEPETLPDISKLQNYPNPFNPETVINFSINEYVQQATLNIFNTKGQIVRKVDLNDLQAGDHNFTWDGTNLEGSYVSSGLYFYQLQTEKQTITKKMILLQ